MIKTTCWNLSSSILATCQHPLHIYTTTWHNHFQIHDATCHHLIAFSLSPCVYVMWHVQPFHWFLCMPHAIIPSRFTTPRVNLWFNKPLPCVILGFNKLVPLVSFPTMFQLMVFFTNLNKWFNWLSLVAWIVGYLTIIRLFSSY